MKKLLNIILILVLGILSFIPPFQLQSVKAIDNSSYAIVNFKTKGCGVTTDYVNVGTGKDGYTNGCYGADAAFLGYENGKVKFKLAGVVGLVEASDVEVLDMYPEARPTYISYYKKENGILKHYVNIDTNYYHTYSTNVLGKEDVGLKEGVTYFSYDGHYFYTDFKAMIDDYRVGTYNRSVNASNPYYNYYQYITNRTLTNHTTNNLKDYINSKWNSKITTWIGEGDMNPTLDQSQLYGEQLAFIQYQNEYGANAYLTFGVAMNESGGGRSWLSYHKNNIFGHNAVDSDPGASASSYISAAQSIKSHTENYVSEGYLDPCDSRNLNGGGYNDNMCQLGRYNGGHIGDKASGMNVSYASDPFWGEKAAAYYYGADAMNGFKDYGKYKLGIKTNYNSYNIYKEANTSSTLLYKTGTAINYPFVILDTINTGGKTWYKIQTDPVLNSTRTAIVQDNGAYDYNNNYAYVESSAVQVVKYGSNLPSRYTIKFYPNGGKFPMDGTNGTKSLTVEQYVTPQIDTPVRDGYIFTGWNETVTAATENITYTAQWRKVGEAEKFDITFNPNGGVFSDTSITNKTITVETGKMPSMEEPRKAGYTFTGWSPAITAATKNTTYTAQYKKNTVYFDITFQADGGNFTDGTSSTVVKTIENEVPTVSNPTKEGYLFTGWTPTLTSATANKTYKATWKKGTIEELLTEKNGAFYFDYLKDINGKLSIKGYLTIGGINNDMNANIKYKIIFENLEDNTTVEQDMNRITDTSEMTRPIPSPDGKNYQYAWFKGAIDFKSLPEGNYRMYLIAYNDTYYSKSIVNNRLYKEQATSFQGDKSIILRNNYSGSIPQLEMIVRSSKLGAKTGSYTYNQFDQYRTFQFDKNNMLNLFGTSYSYGSNMGVSASVKRTMIFENKKNYMTYKFDLGSVTDGLYPAALPVSDNLGKERAWYRANLDLKDIPVGEYVIYISNETNMSDIGEFRQALYGSVDGVKATIAGKSYSFTINKEKRSRIELNVK